MAVTYLILCHQSAENLAVLVRSLYTPETRFIIHVDRKAANGLHEYAASLASRFNTVTVLDSVLCSWGGFSLVEATLNGIAKALEDPSPWQHFVLLSEQHLPLVPAGEVAARLRAGTSYLVANRVANLPPGGRQDVHHRFASIYRELPGVGSFATVPRPLDPALAAELHHGSQWVVLSRAACVLIHASRDDPFWVPFRAAILTDETALQTFMATRAAAAGLPIVYRNLTLVAHPPVSGNKDLIFSDENFFAGAGQGQLFIRKRPATLSGTVTAQLDAGARLSPHRLPPLPATPGRPPAPRIATAELVRALNDRLRIARSSAVVEAMPENLAYRPFLFLRVRGPRAHQPVSVFLLSSDGIAGKLAMI